jgi:nitric oxide reductase NorD protein
MRIDVWLHACFGRSWPIAATDAPPAPGALARALGRRAPWQRVPEPAAGTDGARLFLPRTWLEADPSTRSEALLCAALGLGVRLAAGRAAPLRGAHPVLRDAHAFLEGALADAWLASRFPGLVEGLEGVRLRALASRPSWEILRPSERALETLVRRLLGAPAATCAAGLAGEASAEAVAERARALGAELAAADVASRYRGLPPVPHWGTLRAPTPAPAGAGAPEPAERARTARRSRRLARRVERRPSDPGARERAGPFLPPPLSDPKLSLQDPAGLERPPDRGEEPDLDALASELAAQGELPVVRSDEPASEVLVDDDAQGAEGAAARGGRPSGGDSAYPEWDFRAGGYRLAACRLREAPAPAGDPGWAERVRRERAALLRPMRRAFSALRPRRVRISRQLAGDDLDVPAWVDEWCERRAGLAPEGRIYAQERALRRDAAVALLVDASGSTDAWVSGGARVIDVAKEAALCFCEALGALGDRHAVYAFSGRGPGGVRVWVVKLFEERAGRALDARLAGLAPDASTRLGAALRHVTRRLAEEPTRTRLLLLLSDGKPNDDDEYGGRYGVEDARQAVFEARAAGVRVFCATIDRSGPAYLARLFGPAGFTVLRDVGELPWRLPDLYRRLRSA